MKNYALAIFICYSISAKAQITLGGGANVGWKNVGPKLELCMLNHSRIDVGLNWSRYNIYSNYIGFKWSFKKNEVKNNGWLGVSYEHRYSGKTVIELDDYFYTYRLNNLDYIVPSINYTRRINETSKDKFFLLEVSLTYRILLNNLTVTPDPMNLKTSSAIEDRLTNYFSSGIGLHVGFTLFLW